MVVEVIKHQNYLYSGSYPNSCRNLLRPQLLVIPQVYLETHEKTQAQNKNSQIWDSKRADKANLGK